MIIAEACQNWAGNFQLLLDMVKNASECGAWAVKIQTFFGDDLHPKYYNQFSRINKCELDWEMHRAFVQQCKKYDVVPITSVYSKRYSLDLFKCGFKFIKIGSAQAKDLPLIKAYLKRGMKVLVSTGGWDVEELPKYKGVFGVLHCISKYPHSPYEVDMMRMIRLGQVYDNCRIGYSGHVDPTHPNWIYPYVLARYLGGSIVEAHFTMRRRDETKDGPVSLTLSQLKELCDWDKMSRDEMRERIPQLGALIHPKTREERAVIRKYIDRWVK